jgi:hypothetical protein
MVKKIRILEEEEPEEKMTEEEMSQQFFEIAKSMDWKLWELLQTMQRLEKKLSVVVEHNTDDDF